MIDCIYYAFLKSLKISKKIRIYDLPKVKGGLYALCSSVLSLLFKIQDSFGKKELNGVTEEKRNPNVIVSVTSFPDRINDVYFTLKSIMIQKVKADRIILWLADEEFPAGVSDLPPKFKKLVEGGLEIRFCDNLKPHKKYLYTMKENPDSIVITIDDDVFYPSSLIKDLLDLHDKYKNCIICTRGHRIKTVNNSILPYGEWESNPVTDESPELLLCPTGIGGVLYPPHCLDQEVFNTEMIKQLCLNADDLWLRVMGMIQNTNVVKSNKYPYSFLTVGKSQNFKLSKDNVLQNRNDEQLRNILSVYGEKINI